MNLSPDQLDSSCQGACYLLFEEQAQQLRRKTAVDEQLQYLINEVHCYADATWERQKILSRLLILLQQLPGIYKSNHQDYPQALNDTWEWVCRHIDEFQPRHPSIQTSLVIWVNGYLKWRIIDLYSKRNSTNIISLDQPIFDNEGSQITLLDLLPHKSTTSISLDLLDIQIIQIQESKRQRLGQQIRQQILLDEKKTLQTCHLRQYPECHCQILAKRLLLKQPPDKIAEIAREFQISVQTLYSHWKRKCLPLLQDIGRNCGYEL